jgi:hypothetical protein
MPEILSESPDFEPNEAKAASPAILVLRPSIRSQLSAVLAPSVILLIALGLAGYQLRPYPELRSQRVPDRAVRRLPAAEAPKIDPGELSVAEAKVPDSSTPTVAAPPEEPVPPQPVQTASIDLQPIFRVVESITGAKVEAGEAPSKDAGKRAISEIVWDDIQLEVEEARRNKEAAQALRGESFAMEQESQFARLERARLDAGTNRAKFCSDLKSHIRKYGRDAGPYIRETITVFGKEIEPEVMAAATRERTRLDQIDAKPDLRVRRYRQIGVPDPCILTELARMVSPTIGTRRGPRDGDEVLYFAAKILISVPIDPPAPDR